jgi:hypothetical protein
VARSGRTIKATAGAFSIIASTRRSDLRLVGARQQAEGLEHAAHHAGESRSHSNELGSRSEKGSCLMSIQRLDVDGAVPSCPYHLRQPFRVILVDPPVADIARFAQVACMRAI